jgi:hypothetical protein
LYSVDYSSTELVASEHAKRKNLVKHAPQAKVPETEAVACYTVVALITTVACSAVSSLLRV